ncbi:MAG TPA: PadR family transcriptional regulator [Solirubrobacterales bacterium]|nr:PadR family transcriptional regulator [Solirubrobacterales bacterium]
MSSEIRLTPTSYIVLGLIEAAGEATPYDLKQMVAVSLGNFWSLQHAQLYTEPERLAGAGLLSERREEGGRRRRHYALTASGREALSQWRLEPTDELTELRDLALLKVFFGADPKTMAAAQLPAHRAKLAEYEALQASVAAEMPEGPRVSLQAGVEAERIWVEFWSRLRDDDQGGE